MSHPELYYVYQISPEGRDKKTVYVLFFYPDIHNTLLLSANHSGPLLYYCRCFCSFSAIISFLYSIAYDSCYQYAKSSIDGYINRVPIIGG
jgi:hypothetical protein